MKTNIVKDLFCELCSLQFDKKYVYDVHMKLVHKETLCPQSKTDENVVKKENDDLSEEANFDFVQNSTTKGSVNKNTVAIHEENNTHKCSICGYSCATKHNLKVHTEVIHGGKKPYKCSICDHSFAIKGKLKLHIDSVHNGKKTNKCSICDRSFARTDQLKRHVNSVHEGKKYH